jgi:hypothetical protein
MVGYSSCSSTEQPGVNFVKHFFFVNEALRPIFYAVNFLSKINSYATTCIFWGSMKATMLTDFATVKKRFIT